MKSEHSTGWNRLEPPPPATSHRPAPLNEAIQTYLNLQRRRFHVPAHAGRPLLPDGMDSLRTDPYGWDLTEVEGLDVLSEPSGCLREAQQRVAAQYGVRESFFLVNGASVGLTAAMLSVAGPGDKVLLPRNVHRSVLSGLILSGAQPVWLLPEFLPEWGLWGSLSPDAVRQALVAHPDAKALFVTSPTYEGIGSDIPALAALCRAHGVLLVVDEAHGGLWPFAPPLPNSACRQEADAVVHSLHKSAGSLTQTALAHLPQGSRLEAHRFQQALNTLQTTSPSYLLMANLEATCAWLGSPDFAAHWEAHWQRIQDFRDQLRSSLSGFRLFEPVDPAMAARWDAGRIYLAHPAESGEAWGPRLEAEGRIAYESASPYGVLYVANLGLQAEDYAAFLAVFEAEDARLRGRDNAHWLALQTMARDGVCLPEMAMSPREAFFAPGLPVPASQAVGRVSRETVVHCPPGIPVLMPGERIRAKQLAALPETVWVVA